MSIKKSFKQFCKENMDIGKAYVYAKEKHKGQKRSFSGKPYFVHPKSVAAYVKKYTKDPILTQAAYLHDVLEDTDTDYKSLQQEFGNKVASLVKELTSISKVEMKNQYGGKAQYLTDKMNKMSDAALTIKLCDRLDNVDDKHAPQKFKDRYFNETKYILDNLNRSLNSTHKKIIKKIKDIVYV